MGYKEIQEIALRVKNKYRQLEIARMKMKFLESRIDNSMQNPTLSGDKSKNVR